jgi:hypothetical protein
MPHDTYCAQLPPACYIMTCYYCTCTSQPACKALPCLLHSCLPAMLSPACYITACWLSSRGELPMCLLLLWRPWGGSCPCVRFFCGCPVEGTAHVFASAVDALGRELPMCSLLLWMPCGKSCPCVRFCCGCPGEGAAHMFASAIDALGRELPCAHTA